jgi:hypothetical protein
VTIIRTIDALHPAMRPQALALAESVTREGLGLEVYETLRSPKRQEAGHKRGVSRALPWTSRHQLGMAVDFVGRGPTGGWSWGPHVPWLRYGQLVRAAGLRWGGDWKGFVDCPHAESLRAGTIVSATTHTPTDPCDRREWALWARDHLLPLTRTRHPSNARVLALLCQGALRVLGGRLEHDGIWGPRTEAASIALAGPAGTKHDRVRRILDACII